MKQNYFGTLTFLRKSRWPEAQKFFPFRSRSSRSVITSDVKTMQFPFFFFSKPSGLPTRRNIIDGSTYPRVVGRLVKSARWRAWMCFGIMSLARTHPHTCAVRSQLVRNSPLEENREIEMSLLYLVSHAADSPRRMLDGTLPTHTTASVLFLSTRLFFPKR